MNVNVLGCPGIAHCEQVVCSTARDMTCKHCDNQGSDKRHSLYWPTHARTKCSGEARFNRSFDSNIYTCA